MKNRQASPARGGLVARLFGAFFLVVLSGGVTAALVASAIGPRIFDRHALGGDPEVGADALLHAEKAFRDANSASLTTALSAAVVASLAVSYFISARIGRSLNSLSTVAHALSTGRYGTRATPPNIGSEFDQLAQAINDMASRLERGEELRLRLLADVSHELRTPVATIVAYLEGMEDGVAALTPATKEVLRAQSSRLVRLAEDLATSTMWHSPDVELRARTVSLHELVSTALLAQRPRYAARDVALVSVLDAVNGDDIYIRADVDRMHQVIDNLLENALRHTPSHGTVTVTTEQGPERTAIITVEDTGEGIPVDALPYIFERFYRADTARDRHHGGSGIGLAISKALIEAHGGTIVARNRSTGQGARFTITLPLASESKATT